MPVTRQPAHVGSQHRVQHPDPPVAPARRLARRARSPRTPRRPPARSGHRRRTSITTPPRRPAGRSSPGRACGLPARRPRQPERLRGERHHLRIEVEHHHVVALQPRLVPDMPACRRRPPQPGKCRCPVSQRNGRTGAASSNRTSQHEPSRSRRRIPPASVNSTSTPAASDAESAAARAIPADTSHPEGTERAEPQHCNDQCVDG